MVQILAGLQQAQSDQKDNNMNFNEVYKKIATIDGVLAESSVQECGEMPPAPTGAPTQPMTMSVNLNAQGEEDISSLMRLLTKVNPDMMPKGAEAPLPSVGPELTIGGPGAKVSSPSDAIKGDMMKLLPLDDEKEEEAYANEPDEMNAGIDAVTHDGNDLNKAKGTYPKVAGGDNPMQKVKEELAAALAAYKAR